jgi:hypothetical protein
VVIGSLRMGWEQSTGNESGNLRLWHYKKFFLKNQAMKFQKSGGKIIGGRRFLQVTKETIMRAFAF